MTKIDPQHDADRDESSIRPRPAGRRRLLLRKFVLGFIATCAGLVTADVVFRVVGPPRYAPRRLEPGVPYDVLPNGHFQYHPGTTFASVYDPAGDDRGYLGADGRIEYRINAHGFRGAPLGVDKPADVLRIACLGDSLTFGEGVRDEDTWPVRLGAGWELQPDDSYERVEVLNGGVQGYSLLNCLMMYARRVEPFDPDVVILGLFLNDLMDTGETIQLNDEAHRVRPETGFARYSAIWSFVQRQGDAAARQRAFLESVRASFNNEGRDTLQSALEDFDAYLRARGVALVVAVFPVLWELDGAYPLPDLHDFVTQTCEDRGIACVDLLASYRGMRAGTLWVHPTDHHPNERAQRIAADAIRARVMEIVPRAR